MKQSAEDLKLKKIKKVLLEKIRIKPLPEIGINDAYRSVIKAYMKKQMLLYKLEMLD